MHSKFNRMVMASAAISLMAGCSSAPKVSKNPAEEQALKARANTFVTAGQTESAKAGGYDAIPFWQDRNTVSKKMVREVESGILSKSQKVFLVDFKVRFHKHDTAWLNAGAGLGDFLNDAGQRHGNSNTMTVTIKEKQAIHTFIEDNPAQFQKITDTLYKEFVAQWEAAGYKVQQRDAITYADMKAYLASNDKMVSSPQKGNDHVEIYAPTGWKLEKATMDRPGLGAAFGDTLMKLSEQNSRKVEESIGVGMTYEVDLGHIKDGKYFSSIGVRGAMNIATTYYGGVVEMNEFIKDLAPFKYEAKLTNSDENNAGRATATVAAMALGKSMDYSTSQTFTMNPEWNMVESKVVDHGRHVNDILFERVRQARDD